MFWRLGNVTAFLSGKDGVTRTAVIKTVNCDKVSYLRRSIKHLILSVKIEETQDGESTTTESQSGQDSTCKRLQQQSEENYNKGIINC